VAGAASGASDQLAYQIDKKLELHPVLKGCGFKPAISAPNQWRLPRLREIADVREAFRSLLGHILVDFDPQRL
jgi:hypothetical protein